MLNLNKAFHCHKYSEGKILRPLGATEFQAYQISQQSPHNVIVALECDYQSINKNMILKSLKLLLKLHPILNCSIDINHQNFVLKPSKSFNYSITEHYNCTQKLDIKLSYLVNQRLNAPISIEINHIQSQSKSERVTLIFIVLDHVYCDGLSAIHFAFDLLKYTQTSVPHHFIKPIRSKALDDYLVLNSSHQYFNTQDYFNPINPISTPQNLTPLQTGIQSINFSEQETREIILKSRHMGVSVNSYLSAAALIALQLILNHQNINLNTLVNVRHLLDHRLSERALGMYCGCLSRSYSDLKQSLIYKISQRIQKHNHFALKYYQDKILKDLSLFSQKYKNNFNHSNYSKYSKDSLIQDIANHSPTIGMSNLGLIDRRDFNQNQNQNKIHIRNIALGVTCHAFSQSDSTLFLTALTFNQKLSVCINFPEPVFLKTNINDFNHSFKHTLALRNRL